MSDSSREFTYPREPNFLKVAARCVWKVNAQRDYDSLTCARKFVILTSPEKDSNGRWMNLQLKPQPKKILCYRWVHRIIPRLGISSAGKSSLEYSFPNAPPKPLLSRQEPRSHSSARLLDKPDFHRGLKVLGSHHSWFPPVVVAHGASASPDI